MSITIAYRHQLRIKVKLKKKIIQQILARIKAKSNPKKILKFQHKKILAWDWIRNQHKKINRQKGKRYRQKNNSNIYICNKTMINPNPNHNHHLLLKLCPTSRTKNNCKSFFKIKSNIKIYSMTSLLSSHNLQKISKELILTILNNFKISDINWSGILSAHITNTH